MGDEVRSSFCLFHRCSFVPNYNNANSLLSSLNTCIYTVSLPFSVCTIIHSTFSSLSTRNLYSSTNLLSSHKIAAYAYQLHHFEKDISIRRFQMSYLTVFCLFTLWCPKPASISKTEDSIVSRDVCIIYSLHYLFLFLFSLQFGDRHSFLSFSHLSLKMNRVAIHVRSQ